MRQSLDKAFVTTIKERCRVCYTCVRECPAKAIRIVDGQAEVLPVRCIGCGNCVRVCSQQAKKVVTTIEEVIALLDSDAVVAACIAPSFPAAFPNVDFHKLVGMIRAVGFDYVHEVAFGADLVARRYRELLEHNNGERYIATTCPSIVGFVERYHPELIASLAPIVSPMVALARALRVIYGPDIKVVFIGPCIAKKCEAMDENLPGEMHAATTFVGLQHLFSARGITPDGVEPSDYDPPHAGLGAVFPIGKGMLQAAQVDEDLVAGNVVAADGRERFVEALEEFGSGALDATLLEILACPGCIMGPGIQSDAPLFSRRSRISQYVRQTLPLRDKTRWESDMAGLADLDLSRKFTAHDQRMTHPSETAVRKILSQMGKMGPQDQLNCGACGYDTCREHAVAIYNGLAENKMCLPYTIDELGKTVKSLAVSNQQLAKTQEALLQSEKLASMGQLAAGIAHELNNPLGVVLMYAHLLLEELQAESKLTEDLNMIAQQADRCKKIVAGLLHFARQNKVLHEPVDVRALIDQSLRACAAPGAVDVQVENLMADPIVEVDRDQIVQVLTNLITNACDAMPDGGTLIIRTSDHGKSRFEIGVTDSGTGIPKEHVVKIFEPFFTTKEMGKGTGLGLAVTYGIVKMHRGDIKVKSNADPSAGPTTTTFTVTLPKRAEE
jgi:signal transduction histidine kinase/iron only hydrogenase large subunit-like protein